MGRVPLEGLEDEELESESYRGGVVEDKLDEDNTGKEKEEVIGGFEVVDEALRGIRGKGAPALLAL